MWPSQHVSVDGWHKRHPEKSDRYIHLLKRLHCSCISIYSELVLGPCCGAIAHKVYLCFFVSGGPACLNFFTLPCQLLGEPLADAGGLFLLPAVYPLLRESGDLDDDLERELEEERDLDLERDLDRESEE